uniref:Aromatic-L-amino-acid decarboxylase n=1 Tax=Rhabditophanes sp. KR3021 TaxID=114890 RepID=A0AC35UF40_9BILA
MDSAALRRDSPKFVAAITNYFNNFNQDKTISRNVATQYSDVDPVLKEFIEKYFYHPTMKAPKPEKSLEQIKSSNFLAFVNSLYDLWQQKDVSLDLQTILTQWKCYQVESGLDDNGNTNHENYNDYTVPDLINTFSRPTGISYAACAAEILISGLCATGFSWNSSPSVTESELLMADWVAISVGIPKDYLNQAEDKAGNGSFQYTLHDATLLLVLCARARISRKFGNEQVAQTVLPKDKIKQPKIIGKLSTDKTADFYSVFKFNEATVFPKLIAYAFDEPIISLNKIFLAAGVKHKFVCHGRKRIFEPSYYGELLEKLIGEDLKNKQIPFMVLYSMTQEIAYEAEIVACLSKICRRYDIWFHVNITDKVRYLLSEDKSTFTNGIKGADSIVASVDEMLLMNEPCTGVWIKNYAESEEAMSISATYLRHSKQGSIVDLRHLSVGFSKRYRGIKIWMSMNTYGVKGLADYHKYKNYANPPVKLINPFDDSENTIQHAFDYVASYWDTVDSDKPMTASPAKTIFRMLPNSPPSQGNSSVEIYTVLEIIRPHTAHWLHKYFVAYFPCSTNYACVMGDVLASALGNETNPDLKDLERTCVEMIGQEMALPSVFWQRTNDVDHRRWFNGTASEGTFKACLMAREKVIKRFQYLYFNINNKKKVRRLNAMDTSLIPYLSKWNKSNDPNCTFLFKYMVAYTSSQAHSSVEKSYLLSGVKLRKISVFYNEKFKNYSPHKDAIKKATKYDRHLGLIPFIVTLVIGATSSCGVDWADIHAIPAKKEGLWVHCDAAYLGGFFFLPECQKFHNGFENVDSFVINLHKNGGFSYDIAMFFLHEKHRFDKELNTLGGIPRENRAIKAWFLMNTFGIDGIRGIQRNQMRCAVLFEDLIVEDPLYEVVASAIAGLICFKVKGVSAKHNENIFNAINNDMRIHITESHTESIHYIRFSANSFTMKTEDVIYMFGVIKEITEQYLSKNDLLQN